MAQSPQRTSDESDDPFRRAEADAARLQMLTGRDGYDAAVVLGSGWSIAADEIGEVDKQVAFSDLAHFPPPSVSGHAGVIRSVSAGSAHALVMLGRAHLYEGHSADVVAHAVRTAVLAGCRCVILTNAAGGMRETYRVGQAVLITDHINLTGRNPLVGAEPPAGYPGRFADMTTAYSPRLRALVKTIEPEIPEGVYAAMLGPSYETPAEIRMLRVVGADLVGMSTVAEATAAVHLGAEVLGLSLVTNLAAGLQGAALAHTEVLAAGAEAAPRLGRLLRRIVEDAGPAS